MLCSSRMDEFVTVHVGPDERPFTVHKGFLCNVSSFFRGAFEGRFAEAECMSITLRDESSLIFRTFLEWMYTKRISIQPYGWAELLNEDAGKDLNADASGAASEPRDAADQSAPERELTQDCLVTTLVYLYIFADRRDVPEFRNQIITRLISESEFIPGGGVITYNFEMLKLAYEQLPGQSNLLNLLVAEAAWFWDEDDRANPELQTLPSEFLAHLLRLQPKCDERRKKENYAPWRSSICQFYEHESTPEHDICQAAHSKLQERLRRRIPKKQSSTL